MFNLIKKTLLSGIGLAVMTKDKVEEIARELVEKGKLSEKEGKELIDDLLDKSEKARKDLETKIEGLVQKALAKLDVATQDDISKLTTRIEAIERENTDQSE